jgi:hypothetical protein
VQDRVPGGGPGPLASIVRERRRRALDLYLLVHALASSSPWDTTLAAPVWARLLGLEGSAAASTISKQWTWLEGQRLVKTSRSRRMRQVVLLREDGSGRPYTHPGLPAGSAEGDYFHLPYSYWRGRFQDRFDLPTKAVLLIALSLQDDFIFPLEHASRWYGISRTTLQAGLRTLRTLGFLDMRVRYREAPLTPTGYTVERHYSLKEPFRLASRSPTADGDES